MNPKGKKLNYSNEELTLQILKNVDDTKSQQSLAKELGYSVGKINYVLKALIEKGFIKIENFCQNTNKKQYKYLLTQDGFEEKLNLTKKFVERKKAEYEELQKELEIIEKNIKENK